MVYTSDIAFSWIGDIINNVNFFQQGNFPIIGLLIVFVTAILITPRRIGNIKIILLPLMVGFKIIGIDIPLLLLVLAGIVFVLEVLSIKDFSDMISNVSQKIEEGINFIGQKDLRELQKKEKKLKKLMMKSELNTRIENKEKILNKREAKMARRKLAQEINKSIKPEINE